MTEKYQNRYRSESARLQTWDYGWNAAYFVTICTANRECYFGEIVNDEIRFSEIGELANKYWLEIPNNFPFVKLDAHIVMPNHVHGIIIIDKPVDDDDGGLVIRRVAIRRDAINRGPTDIQTDNQTDNQTQTNTDPQNFGGFAGTKNPMLNNNLSRVIRWYKGRVSFESRKLNADFAWQSRFHDHIIRNNESFERIQQYIINNPKKWGEDKFFF